MTSSRKIFPSLKTRFRASIDAVSKRDARMNNSALHNRRVASRNDNAFRILFKTPHCVSHRFCLTCQKSRRVGQLLRAAVAVAVASASSLSWVADWPATRHPLRGAGWCNREPAQRVTALCGPRLLASTRVPYRICLRASKLWSSDIPFLKRNHRLVDHRNTVESPKSRSSV